MYTGRLSVGSRIKRKLSRKEENAPEIKCPDSASLAAAAFHLELAAVTREILKK